MWISGTTLPETATASGSPATLTWGKSNLGIVKYLQRMPVCMYYIYIQACHALCSSHHMWGKESEPHMS